MAPGRVKPWHHDPNLALEHNKDQFLYEEHDTHKGRVVRRILVFQDSKGQRYKWVYLKPERMGGWTFSGEALLT